MKDKYGRDKTICVVIGRGVDTNYDPKVRMTLVQGYTGNSLCNTKSDPGENPKVVLLQTLLYAVKFGRMFIPGHITVLKNTNLGLFEKVHGEYIQRTFPDGTSRKEGEAQIRGHSFSKLIKG